MIENYQEQKQIEEREPQSEEFAKIGTVYTDGVSLIFAGSETETEKHYKVNSSIAFATGQKVKLHKTSGTYIVEYPVGNPKVG